MRRGGLLIHFRRDIAYCTGGVDSRRVNAALQITSPGFEVWGPPIAIDEASRQKAALVSLR
jgi:hypothetical protein